jgi:hypothetical protein
MPWYAIVETNVALARILGVSQPAIYRAEQVGRIERSPDGSWDVFQVVKAWRASTNPMLQRPSGTFRPWLDGFTTLSPCVWGELKRRAQAEGARVFWEDGDDLEDEEDDDE